MTAALLQCVVLLFPSAVRVSEMACRRRSTISSCLKNMYVFAVIICYICHVSVASRAHNNGCTAVRAVWKSKALGEYNQVPSSPMPGDHLSICGGGGHFMTCCTRQMEAKILSHSRQQFNSILSSKLDNVKQSFQTQASTFENFCTELIDKSGRELHSMFTRTYGILYQQNSQVFTELFRDLRAYFRGGDNDLGDVLDAFFSSLLLRMFTLLNGQYVFDERYLGCISERSNELVPFSDVPQKLGTQVKRAFIAARTFRHGLNVARDVVTLLAKMELSTSCQKAVTKMLYCPMCRGVTATNVKPCSGYCLNVMRGCLVQQPDLITAWTSFIEAMSKVADRLEGPFSIENVLDPMDVKISEAIMNFQENAEAVTSKVFQVCGQPNLGSRSKRDVDRNAARQNRRKQGGNRSTTPSTAASVEYRNTSLMTTISSSRVLPSLETDETRAAAAAVGGGRRTGARTSTTLAPIGSTVGAAVEMLSEDVTVTDNAELLSLNATILSEVSDLPVATTLSSSTAATTLSSSSVSSTSSTPAMSTSTSRGRGRHHHRHRTTVTTVTTTTTTTTTTVRPTTTKPPPPKQRNQNPRRQKTTTTSAPAAAAGAAGRRKTGTQVSGKNAGQLNQGSERNPSGGSSGSSESSGSERRVSSSAHTMFEQMMSEMRTTLTSSQNFLNGFSDAMCVGLSAGQNDETRCWNGTARARYTTPVVDVGAENQVNNREVDYDARRQSTVVNQAILQLRLITEKLKRAHIGQEVEWTDDIGSDDERRDDDDNDYDDDDDLDGSGSGGQSQDNRHNVASVPSSRRDYDGSGYDPSPYQPPFQQPPPRRPYPDRPPPPSVHFPTTKRPPIHYSMATTPRPRVYFTTKSRTNQRIANVASSSLYLTHNTQLCVSIFSIFGLIINVTVNCNRVWF